MNSRPTIYSAKYSLAFASASDRLIRPARDTALNPALALSLCAAAGTLFTWLKVPLPWMIGPMVAMAACNGFGARLRSPRGGRQLGQAIIGTALGLYFTPEVGREVLSYWSLLLLAAALALALSALCGWVLSRTTRTDPVTAFFASVPGGAAEMTVLAERFGAKLDRVALAQSLRILIVVVVVPFSLTYGGASGADIYRPLAGALVWDRLLILLTLSGAAGVALAWLRLPNPYMLGPLFATIALTASAVSFSAMPAALSNAGQLLLGCALGARFDRAILGSLPRFVAGALASIALAIALAGATGVGLAWAYALPVPSLILAMAPGGIAEMCVTAKVLQVGVPLVTAAHVTRVLALVTMTGPIFRAARSLARRSRGE